MSKTKQKEGFFKDAQDVARLIPSGRISTYGAIANYLTSAKAARMVGWAMNAASNDASVPAHRVVNRIGMLSGKNHFETLSRMEELLLKEDIKVKEGQIVDFEKLFWDPSLELEG